MTEQKKIIIQGVELTERPPSVRWYAEAKRLLNILKDYISTETETELNDLLNRAGAFEKLTGGVTLDEMIQSAEDPERIEKLNERIKDNLTSPDALAVLNSIMRYSDKLKSVKDTFVASESIIKNEYGVESMTSNLKLILGIVYEGDFSKINFNTSDIKEILELIQTGTEALEGFFLQCNELKDAFKISPSVMRIIQLETNQTSAT